MKKKKLVKVVKEPNIKVKEVTKAELSRRGRTSKNKGASYEREVAKILETHTGIEFKRTPQSGGFAKKSEKADDFRGDVIPIEKGVTCALHIECKNAKSWSLPMWLRQANEDCPDNKIACVIMHQHKTSNDFITLSLEDFLKLVPPENIARSDK